MNAQLLSLARRFDPAAQSVDFLARCRNTIYKATGPGCAFVLRLTAQSYRTIAQLEGEWAFQRYLHAQGAPVAQPLAATDGSHLLCLPHEEERYHVAAFSLAPGRDWDKRTDDANALQRIGQALGKIHRLSRAYAPARRERRMWYEQPALQEAGALFQAHDAALADRFRALMEEMDMRLLRCGLTRLLHNTPFLPL